MPSVTAPDYALTCPYGGAVTSAVVPIYDVPDPEWAKITVQTSNPAHGTLSPVFSTVPGVAYTYTADVGFSGVDSFTYEADATVSSLTDAGTITITVLPSTTATYIAPPLVSLLWSDDRGHSWGNPVTQSLGATGQYLTSLQWRRLGLARDRVFEISWSSPTRTILQGAWVTTAVADT